MTAAGVQTPLPDDHTTWDDLREAASQVRTRAYAGYSGYAVGAAALVLLLTLAIGGPFVASRYRMLAEEQRRLL